MALNAYLKLKGQKQGTIGGSVTQKGRENTINVFSYSFEGDGSDTGPPQAGVFMVAIDADESSPKILNAFVQNENLTQWELDVYTTNVIGEEVLEQKWELTNASVESFRTGAVIASGSQGPVNEVTFRFQKLTHTWLDGGIEAEWDTELGP